MFIITFELKAQHLFKSHDDSFHEKDKTVLSSYHITILPTTMSLLEKIKMVWNTW